MDNKRKSLLLMVGVVMIITSLLAACSNATKNPLETSAPAATSAGQDTIATEPAQTTEKVKVGFGLYFRNDQWWKDLEAAAVKKADTLGFELLVQDGNQDANLQATQLESFVAQGVKAIIYTPIDGSASSGVVADAKSKGIAVITMETTLDDPSNLTTQMVFDQVGAGYEIGKLAAKFMNDVHGGQGKYVCINDPANNVAMPKCEGFVNAMVEFCPTCVRVEDVNGKTQREPSATATENLLIAHKDLYVIFGAQTDMALGAVGVLEAKGLDASQYFVGGEGWGDEAYEALTGNGYMKAVCITPGIPLGETALEAVASFINDGTPYEPLIKVPADIVTAENAKAYFGK